MAISEPSAGEFFPEKKNVRNPLVPVGAFITAGVLTAGLISFRRGNSHLGQKLMRARVVVQGATVALMNFRNLDDPNLRVVRQEVGETPEKEEPQKDPEIADDSLCHEGIEESLPDVREYIEIMRGKEDLIPSLPTLKGSELCKGVRVRLPKHFDKPTDLKYEGKSDPQEHIDTFDARISLEGVGDAIRFKTFSVTLSGPEMGFITLLSVSIFSFHDIKIKFLAHFTIWQTQANHPISLLDVGQRVRESIRYYLDRFNKVLLEVNTRILEVVCLCLIAELLEGNFRRHLTSKDV
ncbi:hypothetical protein AHAS_Ahas02G0146900 [Arachis hypogaea]